MKKIFLFVLPILVNIMLYIVCVIGNVYGGWLKYGGSAAIKVCTNAIVLPIYIIFVMFFQLKKDAKKGFYLLIISFIIMQSSLFLDFMGSVLLGGAIDSAYILIFNTERFFNTSILIFGWLIIKIILYATKKQNRQ